MSDVPQLNGPFPAPLAPRHRRRVQQVASRHGRRKSGLILCEGLRCCQEALARRPGWLEFGVCTAAFAESAPGLALRQTCHRLGRELVLADDREFAALAATTNPQGILCILNRPPADVPLPQVLRPPFVLVLDRVGEPGNLGTILRTAWAVGLQQVWFTNGTTDPFGPKAIRAGMGAQFALDLREYPGLPEIRTALQRLGLERLWLAVPRGGVSCFAGEFDFRGSGLVIGNEATGVTACAGAETVTIPMPGMSESLNAAQAATVLLFEAVRRGFLPPDPLPEPVRDR